MANKIQYWGTGRRKTSVARVRLIPGENGIVINGKDLTSMMEAITKTKTELEGTIKLLKECLDV